MRHFESFSHHVIVLFTLFKLGIWLDFLVVIIIRILLIKLTSSSGVTKLLKDIHHQSIIMDSYVIDQSFVLNKVVYFTAMFRALRSAFFLAAKFFSVILFSMTASSSLVKGRKVGRLLSDSFSAWFSDMVGTSSGNSGSRYHLQKHGQ